MSLFESIVGGGIAEPIKAAGDALDKVFTSDKERGEIEIAKQEIVERQNAAQNEINKIEAASNSLFISGWRPFIGWICAFALLWQFMLFDLLYWVTYIFELGAPPRIEEDQNLITIVISLLGLGGMRTYEKTQGIEK